MDHPLEALIHLPALAHNLARVRQVAGLAKVWAAVESDACGHGLARCHAALRAADGLAVFTPDEARQCRALGWRGPVWLRAGAFSPRDLELCSRLNVWHTVHCETQIDWLAMHKTQQPHRVFLPLRTRPGALGFAPEAFRSAWTRLNALPQVDEITLVLVPEHSPSDRHRAAADEVLRDLPGERGRASPPAPGSTAATRADEPADWVVASDALYGACLGPGDIATPEEAAARSTMTLRARLVAIHRDEAVDAASPWVGVVACGLADGYPLAATELPVLVDGLRTRTLGRAGRQTVIVDLAPLRAGGLAPSVGSEVTLWGHGPSGAHLPIADVARAAGCEPADLLSAVPGRVPMRCDPDPASGDAWP